jgi:hypothetical protein
MTSAYPGYLVRARLRPLDMSRNRHQRGDRADPGVVSPGSKDIARRHYEKNERNELIGRRPGLGEGPDDKGLTHAFTGRG